MTRLYIIQEKVCTIFKNQEVSGAMWKAILDKMLNQAYATGTFHLITNALRLYYTFIANQSMPDSIRVYTF